MSIKRNLYQFIKFPQTVRSAVRSQISYEKVGLHEVLKDELYAVDEITSQDMQLESFAAKYDNCKTSCGSDLFHHWLHSIKTKDQISEIQKDLQLLSNFPYLSLINKYLLKNAGKQKEGCLVRDLWNGFSVHHFLIDNFYWLYFLNFAVQFTLSLLFTKYFPVFIVLFFLVNFALFVTTNKYISHVTASLGYFFSLCNTIQKIDKKTKLKLFVPTPDYRKFNNLLFFSMFFKQGVGGPSSGDMLSLFVDYFRIFFAFELLAFKKVEKVVLKNQENIRNIYLYVGYVDCLLNVLNIIEENNCCFAEITENKEIYFENLKHPLVEKSLGQSKKIDKNLIVTGLNMSGKTTFMKSVGINQLLATSFGFCFADSFKTSIFDLLSSICINDSLLNGKSRYYAEAERLVEIKQLLKSHRCICFIDEILSGTNSDERIEGSTKILSDFAGYDSILIAATHDTQIAKNLCGSYEPVYFDGEIQNDRIIFDYKIKEGIVSKKNGLLILKLLEK